MFKAIFDIKLAGTNFVGARIPGDGGLGSGAAGGGAHLNDLGEGGLGVMLGVDFPMHRLASALHQFCELDGGLAGDVGAAGWAEFQRAHAAFSHVGKTIKWRNGRFGDTFAGHPGIDQTIAEIIRERVGQ